MIKITFPDGSIREYESGVNGFQIAESISSRLAQDVIAVQVNDEVTEINRPITEDATIKLFKWDDAEGKHAFWHTSAHLMAEALQELYPGIQFGIGPAIENGFYYDVDPGTAVIKEGGSGAVPGLLLSAVLTSGFKYSKSPSVTLHASLFTNAVSISCISTLAEKLPISLLTDSSSGFRTAFDQAFQVCRAFL